MELNEFLTHLAVNENVAASTQNQPLCAILFLYKEVLHQELDLHLDSVRAKRPQNLPTVMAEKYFAWNRSKELSRPIDSNQKSL
jgi:Phage integrase, N-terminal SAM-like domain